MKKKYWLSLAGVTLVLVAWFIWYKKNQQNLVNTEAIKRGKIVESVYGIGVLTAVRSLSIKSGVTSTIREQIFDGSVESIFSNGSDFMAHISVKELPKFILPGMTADVAIILQEKKDVLLIPVASIELKDAILIRNGKTIRVPIKLGLVDGAYAEVLSGDVQVGDEAVIVKREVK